jgi:polysaccharide biosynthesis transport protein
MQPAEVVHVLAKRWVYVALPLLLSLGFAAFLTSTSTKIYEAAASMYFTLPYSQSATDLLQGSNYTQQQLLSYATLATKPIVLDRVIDDLGLDVSASTLSGSVSAVASADTVIIEVRASSPSPELAADIANAVTRELAVVVAELAPAGQDDEAVIQAVVVADATPPSSPASPNTRLNLAAALIGGLFLGILAAIGRERIDVRVRDASDIPEGLPVLATMHMDKTARSRPLVVGSSKSRVRAEAFRRLRTNLRFIGVDDEPVRVIAVTSAVAGEGKSSTASNLALVLAEAGQRVVLVDADLRLPRVADYVNVEGSVGLTDVLGSRLDLRSAIQHGPSGLMVLASGTLPPNPSELLGSHRMSDLTDELRGEYDYVVIDTPALLPVTDGSVVAALADGVVVVAGYGRARHSEFERALESLNAVGARILGVVFNQVPTAGGKAASRGYGPYLEGPVPDVPGTVPDGIRGKSAVNDQV